MKQLKSFLIHFFSSSSAKGKTDQKTDPVPTNLMVSENERMTQLSNSTFSKCTKVDREGETDLHPKEPVAERKRIPLSQSEGFVERVRFAVKPLTDCSDFTLKSVSYRDHWREDGGSILLISNSMNIRYNFRFDGSAIICSFKLPSIEVPFYAEYLFATRKIPVSFGKCHPLRSLSGNEREKKFPGISKITQYLDESGMIEELNRLCIQMADNMPAIQGSFSPENLDETLHRYTQDYCNKNKWATRQNLPKKPDSVTPN